MTPARFAADQPCLDEIAGYMQGLRWLGITYTAEEMEPLLRWEVTLREGKDLPKRTGEADQTWTYRRKMKPVRRQVVMPK